MYPQLYIYPIISSYNPIIWVCLNMLCTPLYPMVNDGFADHYPYEKWLFHWGYTQFSDIPIWLEILRWRICQLDRNTSSGGCFLFTNPIFFWSYLPTIILLVLKSDICRQEYWFAVSSLNVEAIHKDSCKQSSDPSGLGNKPATRNRNPTSLPCRWEIWPGANSRHSVCH